MSELVSPPTEATTDATAAPARGSPYGALARHIQHAGLGERAALARLQADALKPHEIAALSRALLAAGLQPESWRADTWPRWALIAQGMALTGHNSQGRLGRQMSEAGVSESRVSKLLTARGDAFRQLLPRVLRLMASKGVAPNWFELGELVLKAASTDRADQQQVEVLRLRIAGPYFSAQAKAARA
jgi:CRISPR system Cascade subunit CasB